MMYDQDKMKQTTSHQAQFECLQFIFMKTWRVKNNQLFKRITQGLGKIIGFFSNRLKLFVFLAFSLDFKTFQQIIVPEMNFYPTETFVTKTAMLAS